MLWQLWQMSQTWTTRPSELIGLTDSYAAWCLDEACMAFGQACEEVMSDARARGKGKTDAQRNGAAMNALRKMLGLKQKFRDISELTTRRPAADLPPAPFERE